MSIVAKLVDRDYEPIQENLVRIRTAFVPLYGPGFKPESHEGYYRVGEVRVIQRSAHFIIEGESKKEVESVIKRLGAEPLKNEIEWSEF